MLNPECVCLRVEKERGDGVQQTVLQLILVSTQQEQQEED